MNAVSFALLIGHLNINVRTFRLTQELQALTLDLQEKERLLAKLECDYYTTTRPDQVYAKAHARGMKRDTGIRFIRRSVVQTR